MAPDDRIWLSLEHCIDTHLITIDRPKGSRHPRFPDMIYPLDYGFLNGTAAGDGEGIDIFVGSDPLLGLTGLAITYDPTKADTEIKLLHGCTDGEIATVTAFLKEAMPTLVVRRQHRPQS